jgi:hypothetical protein
MQLCLHNEQASLFKITEPPSRLGGRKAELPVVPGSRPLHEQGVDGVNGQRSDRLQNVGDRRRSRARVAVVVHHVREHASDARTVFVLNKHVSVIGIATDSGEDHGCRLHAEEPARLREPDCYPRRRSRRRSRGRSRARPPPGTGAHRRGSPSQQCTPAGDSARARSPCFCRRQLHLRV